MIEEIKAQIRNYKKLEDSLLYIKQKILELSRKEDGLLEELEFFQENNIFPLIYNFLDSKQIHTITQSDIKQVYKELNLEILKEIKEENTRL